MFLIIFEFFSGTLISGRIVLSLRGYEEEIQ